MDEEEAAPAPLRKASAIARIFKSHDFLRDLTVTTLGVLIALAIGEAVNEVRWKLRVDATERVMREELGLVSAVYIEKQMLQPCISRRLTELTEILTEARASGRLPLVQNVSYPPNHAEFGDSWALMIGSDTPLHMDPRRLMNMATTWVNNDAFTNLVDRERDAFDRLSMIENRPGPVSDNILSELERQLIEAKIASDSSHWIARQDSEVLKDNGIRPMYQPDEPLDRRRLAENLRQRFVCQPLRVDGRPYVLKGPVRTPAQPAPS